MQKLENKVAIITGAMRGIGFAAAKLMLAQGAKVMLVDLSEDGLKKAALELGSHNVAYVVADVTQTAAVQNYVAQTVKKWGKIDIFFNNAGVGGEANFSWDYLEEDFDRTIAVNIKGVWLGLKYVIPVMKESGGSIILTSSAAGLKGMPKGIAYSASKHAVVGMMKTAALESAYFKIRVNSIHPGPIETDMVRDLESSINPNDREEAQKKLTRAIPLRRYGTVEEVADLVSFLASSESKYITGGIFSIDGGILLS
jgi:NAD(P)-dependent dehydrogenase (short-subunit alcohol dehydrogenase family)